MTTTVTEPERTLATLERITALAPIENADAIESAMVRGWNVVVKKGEFAVDDLVIYLMGESAPPFRVEVNRLAFDPERITSRVGAGFGRTAR